MGDTRVDNRLYDLANKIRDFDNFLCIKEGSEKRGPMHRALRMLRSEYLSHFQEILESE